jgi:3-hydroxy-9,10-secoandrosta-1,3,5(10)-triene-9,17-dione monooxygenase reductase component
MVTFDSSEFRRILGHYPTGVCAVTAMEESAPLGMVVGSFTSVSLDPPLVAFFADRNSRSWARIEAAGRFCVNVLGEHQREICRALASRAQNKFDGVSYRQSSTGLPIIEEAIAWIDCDLHAVHEAGDHLIALGKVHSLDIAHPGRPLLFFQGGYGRFSPFQEKDETLCAR